MEAEHVVDDIEGPATTSAGITDSNPAVANTDSEIVVSDFKPTTGFADDQANFLAVADGRVKFNCTTKQFLVILFTAVLVLCLFPLLTSGGPQEIDDGGVTVPAAAGQACSLPAPVGSWSVEYFPTTDFTVASVTQCENPNRPAVQVDAAASAAIAAFYQAVDVKDIPALSGAVSPDYTATVNGCAAIGGARVGCDEWASSSSQQSFNLQQFSDVLNSWPARPGGYNPNRQFTADSTADGTTVVINHYTMNDGSSGTAVHFVNNGVVTESEWYGGALDARDVAQETTAAIQLSHIWGDDNIPGPAALNGQHEHFAVRYSGEFSFTNGTWQFFVSSDDGSRLFVDGVLILNRFSACCDIWHADPLVLAAGTHSIVLEYQQHGGNAFVQLGWQPFQNCPSAAPLHMQIFPTSDLSGDPSVASTCVSAVREHWGQHPWLGPELGVRDQFSARWVGNVDFIPHPAYVFSSFADDGSRLFIDDMLVLDKWDQCCQAFSSAPVDITGTSTFGSAVTKLLRYEIHDMGGLAFAYLSWAPIESQPLSSWHADESYVETVAITSGADDIEIWGTSEIWGTEFASSIDTSSSDLELVVDGSRNPQTVALLFRDIQVDKNAVILAASVQFHADESQSEVTNLAVRAVSCSDGHCPNSLPSSAPVRLEVSNAGGVFDNHALTASAVQWSNVPAWTVDSHETSTQAEAAQRTPDLQTVIQEVINSDGWVRGRDLAIIITGSGHRTADSFDGHPNKASSLTVVVQGRPSCNGAGSGR